MTITDIEEFAARVQALGNEYGYPPLGSWGTRLRQIIVNLVSNAVGYE
jgi:signal transduction histidine kinase